jgi:diguanylate cyclase (GGDEF)-like protein
VGFLSAVLPFVLGIIMAIYWRSRRVYEGFGHWVVSNLLLGAGFLLIDLRGFIPGFFSIIVGNVLTVYSMLLIYDGVQFFFDRPALDLWNYGIFAAYTFLQLYFTYMSDDIHTRILLSSAVFFILNIRVGTSLYWHAPPQLLKTSRSASSICFILALVNLTRGISTWNRAGPTDLLTDPVLFWYTLAFVISIVVWTFYFFFLTSTRLELELDDARQELVQIASTDPLTGLYNRRHFFEHAEIGFQHAKRSRLALSFLILDIDHFKSINDRYGHAAGDAVLVHLASILRAEFRSYDTVARYGGDEFVALLTNVNQRQALVIAERIRSAVERSPVSFEARAITFRFSAGISSLRPKDPNLHLALKRADDALYKAKEEGRNRVVVA